MKSENDNQKEPNYDEQNNGEINNDKEKEKEKNIIININNNNEDANVIHKKNKIYRKRNKY